VSVVPALAAIQQQAAGGGPAGQPWEEAAGRGAVVLAAGPGLDGALAELEELRGVYPAATSFSAATSRVDDVLAALEGSRVAHLACHGRFRVDNPMFSSLELADGAVTVFDLEKLERAPALVVLAACDVGSAAVSAGDELLGLAAALHRAGTRTVVASLVPVPDDLVVQLMAALHRGVAAGQPAAVALAGARAGLDPDGAGGHGPGGVAVKAAFTCFGLG
jgi:CHAT domain-containing protein